MAYCIRCDFAIRVVHPPLTGVIVQVGAESGEPQLGCSTG